LALQAAVDPGQTPRRAGGKRAPSSQRSSRVTSSDCLISGRENAPSLKPIDTIHRLLRQQEFWFFSVGTSIVQRRCAGTTRRCASILGASTTSVPCSAMSTRVRFGNLTLIRRPAADRVQRPLCQRPRTNMPGTTAVKGELKITGVEAIYL